MAKSDAIAFNPKALWVARSFRELSVSELAEKAGVARQTVSAIENGGTPPFRPALHAIADALGFPIEYFATHPEIPTRDVFHFRRETRVPEYALARATAHGAIFASVASSFSEFAVVTKPRLPCIEAKSPDDIERAADTFREAIKIRADSPITSALRAAEAAGVFVGTFDPGGVPIHGFACFLRVPLLMVSATSTWSRRRFSTMHEVGHLVLHRQSSPDEKEEQANRFAGAALIPRAAFWREFPRPVQRRFDWAALVAMKRRWGVSIQAIIYRAHDLGIIDGVQFRTANIYITNQGWKRNEPAEAIAEEPAVCAAFITELRKRASVMSLCNLNALSADVIGKALGVVVVPEPEVSQIIPIGKGKRP